MKRRRQLVDVSSWLRKVEDEDESYDCPTCTSAIPMQRVPESPVSPSASRLL
jgi:hypothetical protein